MTEYDIEVAKEYTILEERIAELEKENAELESDIELLKNGETLKELQAEVFRLTKENAELKEAIKHFNPCCEWDDDAHDCEFRHYAMEYGSNLTKAKEIIRNLLFFLNKFYSDECPVCMDEAEQFLKEESRSKWVNPVRTTNDNQIKLSEVEKNDRRKSY